jgi:uncharacterized NAD-dependent epimerase/dehydratase family protein
MLPGALILTQGLFKSSNAKTAHGLIRGTARFEILGVVDLVNAGRDAGTLLDGRERGIPIHRHLAEALAAAPRRPEFAIVGIATPGGVLPDALRATLAEALEAGLSIVNGLHDLASEDPILVEAAKRSGAQIIDIRRPRPFRELSFWTGRIREVGAPRLAVLGTDCALGKRTTCGMLLEACRGAGMAAEMVYTGQTGWLQGLKHGLILDATPNDFVSGELENAIVACWEETRPELILIEGQSGLRNPTGPCGAELLLSAGAEAAILQHAPARTFYKGAEQLEARIPAVADEIELIGRYGTRTLGVAINEAGLRPERAVGIREELERELGLPVALPLQEGVGRLMEAVRGYAAAGGKR